MKCPNCNETLLMSERQTVEIDYCPSCRGVWLDKGELDKLMEIAAQNAESSSSASNSQVNQPQRNDFNQQQNTNPNYNQQQGGYGYGYDNYKHNKYHGRKKKSFLSDIFDFD